MSAFLFGLGTGLSADLAAEKAAGASIAKEKLKIGAATKKAKTAQANKLLDAGSKIGFSSLESETFNNLVRANQFDQSNNPITGTSHQIMKIDEQDQIISGWQITSQSIYTSGSENFYSGSDLPYGIELNSSEGIFGHGDTEPHTLKTFDGMFAFIEGHISTEDGTVGQTSNTESIEIQNWNGNDYIGGGGAGGST